MKVLLIGEFSSLHRYLKEGLLELGVDVKLAANGDSWKKISGADMPLFDYTRTGFAAKIWERYFNSVKTARKFSGYDVIQPICPIIYRELVNQKILRILFGNNRIISLEVAGGHYNTFSTYEKGVFDYSAFDYDKGYSKLFGNSISGRLNRASCNYAVEKADIIIPGLYDYAVGYIDNKKCYSVIPMPINTDSIKYAENKLNQKIVFFHGLNRELFKGTKFIREAMERLKKNYPDEVEIVLDGHMPFDKYVELMKKTNVIIDQCCSYGYGINACIAMAQGKVVLSGARQEALDAFGIDKCPVFCIKPDADQIYEKLEYILKNKNMIPQWGFESRQYVEDLHHYVKIAQKYIDAWRSTGKL